MHKEGTQFYQEVDISEKIFYIILFFFHSFEFPTYCAGSECNCNLMTLDGVDIMGVRLAEEVDI